MKLKDKSPKSQCESVFELHRLRTCERSLIDHQQLEKPVEPISDELDFIKIAASKHIGAYFEISQILDMLYHVVR